MAIIASEPLTDNKDDWVPVPRNSIVVMTRSSPACPVNVINIPIGKTLMMVTIYISLLIQIASSGLHVFTMFAVFLAANRSFDKGERYA